MSKNGSEHFGWKTNLQMKGYTLIRLGLGNVAFITFAAMLGIMAVVGLARILGNKNIPVLSSVGKYVDTAWKAAA